LICCHNSIRKRENDNSFQKLPKERTKTASITQANSLSSKTVDIAISLCENPIPKDYSISVSAVGVKMLQQEKLEQAISILKELNIDAWLIFARETEETPERSWALLAPGGVVWQSALILTPHGDRIAIVGQGDDDTYRKSSCYSDVYSYTQSIREQLRESLRQINPRQLAINFSKSNSAADGLSHGMYLLLRDHLEGLPCGDHLVSADPIISRLRGRKTPQEVARIRAAIGRTLELFDEATELIKPGMTEREVAAYFHKRLDALDLEPAWTLAGCPIVNAGPNSPPGHSAPSDIQIEPGQLVHVDFGLKQDGYCSDLQRMWYLARPGESHAPQELRRAFNAVAKTIREAAQVLKPGVTGWQVDALAREVITSEGYPEYQHALGHQLGRTVHDGSTLLGPRWERYGDTPYGVVEENQVYTLELGVSTDAGYMGLEEDVLVKADGVEWLSPPQAQLMLVTL
jgi:Xaa-Pro aminopeptidase